MNSSSLSRALLSSTALIAVGLGSAFAQEADEVEQTAPEEAGEAQGDRIVVTGSRIRQSTITSPVSMDVLSVDAARVAGVSDVAGLLQSSSAAAGSNQITSAVSTAYVSDGGVGAETVGLRGLGAGRTLDLINGRRAGPSGTRGSVNAFDLGSIPLVGVERVDVLKDGASSIYGSDAIAGVINYIIDRSDGGEIDFYTELPVEQGGEVFRASASYGDSFERGRYRVTADYYQREELARRDRSYLDCRESYTFSDASLSTRADIVDPRFGTNQCSGTIWGHVWAYNYSGLPDPDNVAWNPRNRIFQFDRTGTMAGLVPAVPPSLDGSGIGVPPGWYQVEYLPGDIEGLPAFAGVNIDNRNPDRVTDLYPRCSAMTPSWVNLSASRSWVMSSLTSLTQSPPMARRCSIAVRPT
jgi:iron complex outermembrane receptor protein